MTTRRTAAPRRATKATPDPDEAVYRVSKSKSPFGMKVMATDAGVPYVTVDGEQFSIEHALKEGWVDQAPAIRRRATAKPAETPAENGAAMSAAEERLIAAAEAPGQPPAWPLIYRQMASVMRDLGPIPKTKENAEQHFRFRGIDQVMNHLSVALPKAGIVVVPRVLERERSMRTTRSGSALWVTDLHIEFTFFAEDGSSIVASTWGEGVDNYDKSTSKAHTFAHKSCLLEAFMIATEDLVDPDAASGQEETTAPKEFDGEEWARENGWPSWKAHVDWKAKAASLLKGDAQLVEAFLIWRKRQTPVVHAFSEGPFTKVDADKIDAFFDGKPPEPQRPPPPPDGVSPDCTHPEISCTEDGVFVCDLCQLVVPDPDPVAEAEAETARASEGDR